jgi:Cyclin
MITSVLVASKFFDDYHFRNSHYAKVGGISTPEMNLLEVEFLLMVRFNLFVSIETYQQYYNQIRAHAYGNDSPCGCKQAKVQIPLLILPHFDPYYEAKHTQDEVMDLPNSPQRIQDRPEKKRRGGWQCQCNPNPGKMRLWCQCNKFIYVKRVYNKKE